MKKINKKILQFLAVLLLLIVALAYTAINYPTEFFIAIGICLVISATIGRNIIRDNF
jgi:hypothetical protein